MGLFSFSKKNNKDSVSDNILEGSWYQDRYESILVQRNLMFIFALGCIIATILAIFFIGKISLSKTIEPMVIEVEESSGITNIVNPNQNRRWTQSKALNQYFIIKYLRARETYNIATYLNDYNLVVRLMSFPSCI